MSFPAASRQGEATNWAVLLAVAGLVLLTRLPYLTPSGDALLFDVDELELAYSSLDRFLGVPATNLAWPSSTLQMMEVALVGVAALVDLGPEGVPQSLVRSLAALYAEPWAFILAVRLLVAVVFSLGAASLYAPLRNLLGSRTLALQSVFVLATVPQVWLHSGQAQGHGLALGFACAACAAMIEPKQPRAFAFAGVFVGLAAASRITAAPLAPLILGIGLQQSAERRLSSTLRFGFWGLAAFTFACPYVWTDPVRILKSVLGNASRGGAPMGLTGAVEAAAASVTPWILLAGGIAWLALAFRRKAWVAAGGALTLALFVLPTAAAGIVFSRHLIALAVACVALGALALAEAKPGTRADWSPAGVGTASLLAGGLILANLAAFSLAGAPGGADPWQKSLRQRLGELKKDTLFLAPFWSYPYVASLCSSHALRQAADASLRSSSREAAEALPQGPASAQRLMSALPAAFSEDEQSYRARLRVLAETERDGLQVVFWAEPRQADRFGVLSREEAIDLFRSTASAAALLDVPLEGEVPAWSFGGDLYLYVYGGEPRSQ